MPELTSEQKQQYDELGYVLLKDLFRLQTIFSR